MLNRRRVIELYRGFESLPLRHAVSLGSVLLRPFVQRRRPVPSALPSAAPSPPRSPTFRLPRSPTFSRAWCCARHGHSRRPERDASRHPLPAPWTLPGRRQQRVRGSAAACPGDSAAGRPRWLATGPRRPRIRAVKRMSGTARAVVPRRPAATSARSSDVPAARRLTRPQRRVSSLWWP